MIDLTTLRKEIQSAENRGHRFSTDRNHHRGTDLAAIGITHTDDGRFIYLVRCTGCRAHVMRLPGSRDEIVGSAMSSECGGGI